MEFTKDEDGEECVKIIFNNNAIDKYITNNEEDPVPLYYGKNDPRNGTDFYNNKNEKDKEKYESNEGAIPEEIYFYVRNYGVYCVDKNKMLDGDGNCDGNGDLNGDENSDGNSKIIHDSEFCDIDSKEKEIDDVKKIGYYGNFFQILSSFSNGSPLQAIFLVFQLISIFFEFIYSRNCFFEIKIIRKGYFIKNIKIRIIN